MWSFAIPLLCSLLYPLGTLLIKRGLDKGADLWSSMAINYWAMAIVFLPALALESRPIPWALWYQPAFVGLTSFLGQAFALKAVSSGHLTIATPALGSKVLLVALLTVFILNQAVPLSWWIAALLSFAAVFFLQAGGKTSRRGIQMTLAYSLLAAACFALGDVHIQKWAPRWGAFHFMPAFAIAAAVYSLGLFPFMKRPLFANKPDTWNWVWIGSGLLGVQSLGLTAVIGLFGKVTLVNVLFSSRGLWNFLLVWFGGHWFANREREMGPKIMASRLVGAALMFAAIVLVSWRRG